MSWAARRRFIILLIIGITIVAFFVLIGISTFYKTPTCIDGIQNQGESGIDCGGPCQFLCADQLQAPVILFTKAIKNVEGRTDVVAMVENKNTKAAAKNVSFKITLYDTNNIFIQEVNGITDLPAGSAEPVYVPGIASGKQKVDSAFLTIDASAIRWFSMFSDARIIPVVSNIIKKGTISNPRVEAILSNSSTAAIKNVQVIVLVYDSRKNIITASKTIVPTISGQGQAVATFTWNEAFTKSPALIEVIPIVPIP